MFLFVLKGNLRDLEIDIDKAIERLEISDVIRSIYIFNYIYFRFLLPKLIFSNDVVLFNLVFGRSYA
jgi:hypothetical protein